MVMNELNIAIVGTVSVGKSTLLNAILKKLLSKAKMDRTTMLPTSYTGLHDLEGPFEVDFDGIQNKVDSTNKGLFDTTSQSGLSAEQCKEMSFETYKFKDFISKEDMIIRLFDIPGLDDLKTKDVYFDWIKTNAHRFDIIIFMTSIPTALNVSSEMEILRLVLGCIARNKTNYSRHTELVTVINKCDNMTIGESMGSDGKIEDKIEYHSDEYKELSERIAKTIEDETVKFSITKYTGPIPISANDMFTYRQIFNVDPKDFSKIPDASIRTLGALEYSAKEWAALLKSGDFADVKIKIIEKIRNEADSEPYIRNSGYNILQRKLNSLVYSKLPEILKGKLQYEFMMRQKLEAGSNLLNDASRESYISHLNDIIKCEIQMGTLLDKSATTANVVTMTDIVIARDLTMAVEMDKTFDPLDKTDHNLATSQFRVAETKYKNLFDVLTKISDSFPLEMMPKTKEFLAIKCNECSKLMLLLWESYLSNESIIHTAEQIKEFIAFTESPYANDKVQTTAILYTCIKKSLDIWISYFKLLGTSDSKITNLSVKDSAQFKVLKNEYRNTSFFLDIAEFIGYIRKSETCDGLLLTDGATIRPKIRELLVKMVIVKVALYDTFEANSMVELYIARAYLREHCHINTLTHNAHIVYCNLIYRDTMSEHNSKLIKGIMKIENITPHIIFEQQLAAVDIEVKV